MMRAPLFSMIISYGINLPSYPECACRSVRRFEVVTVFSTSILSVNHIVYTIDIIIAQRDARIVKEKKTGPATMCEPRIHIQFYRKTLLCYIHFTKNHRIIILWISNRDIVFSINNIILLNTFIWE